MDILVSPAEPPVFQSLGSYSPEVEANGTDFMWDCPLGRVGVQRKEVHDLVASLGDGRLQREVGQAAPLDLAYVVIEGPLQWRKDGTWFSGHWGVRHHFTRKHLAGLTFSLTAQGVGVLHTETSEQTIQLIRWLYEWTHKPSHTYLKARPKPRGAWGTATNGDYQLHLLQGFQGVGPGTAAKIVAAFGGVPLRWSCTMDQLRKVPGIGKKRAQAMFDAVSIRCCECSLDERMLDGDNPGRCYRCAGVIVDEAD